MKPGGDRGPIIYPNPARNRFIIKFPGFAGAQNKILLTDLTGTIIRVYYPVSSDLLEVDCDDLQKGIYLIEISGTRVYRRKILLQ